MKVVILGGSAHSTPALWSYMVHEAQIPDLNVVLVGRDILRVNAVVRACKLLGKCEGSSICGAVIPDWPVLEGADIVLIQIRNGGYAARAYDETFPHRYGIVGDEGLGPGGLCAALRNWKAIAPAIEQTARFAPHALILMLSSPLGLLVRASMICFPHLKIAGICELPWTTFADTCSTLGVEPAHVCFDYFGVNHLGWVYGICKGEQEISPAVPLKYLRLHKEPEAVLEEQRQTQRSRATQLQEISRKAFQLYAGGDADAVRKALELRSTPWYRYAVGPLIAAFAGREVPITFFLSTRNDGFDSAYRDGDVLEYAHTIRDGKITRVARVRSVPIEMLNEITPFIEYERLGAQGVLNPNISILENSLRAHPWTQSSGDIRQMTRDLMNYANA
jgi:6-phospho-beta-glucosidase